MIVGINGKSRSGKDTVADMMCKEFGFVKVSLADPMKRACAEWFGWSEETLWGESELRNVPDAKFVRMLRGALGSSIRDWNDEKQEYNTVPTPERDEYLTPRHALQQLGTEFGRNCYKDVWVEYLVRVADNLEKGGYAYHNTRGLYSVSSTDFMSPKTDVAVPDVRFENEVDGLKKAGAVLIRVKRPGSGLEGAAGAHVSETEQDGIPDSDFDFVINNEGTLAELHLQVKEVMRTLKGEVEGAQRADDFLAVITRMDTAYPENSDVVSEELDVKFGQVLPGRLSVDSDETVEMELSKSGRLSEMLRQREEDIKAGRLMEYDDSQKDVPPFLRKK